MTDKTPAQAAKEFAAEHNIHLYAYGRRYRMFHNDTPLNLIAEVGGYPAALNAMRKWLNDESMPVEMCAGGTLVLPELSANMQIISGEGVTWGKLEPITPDTVPMSREEMFAPVKEELDQLSRTREETNKAVYGDERGMKGVDYAFDDFTEASKARIRHAAYRIARKASKLSGKPPGGPWYVIFNGATVMKYGYPSRAEAVAVVRWGFNHPDPIINNNWRTASLAVEYRA